jgi:hypothetical protein
MAPSNLNQVFVANDNSDTTNGTLITGSTFSVNAAANASKVGVWNLAANAYLTTSLTAAVGPIQIVQTMPSGNPIASPIIDIADIKRIKYDIYTASTRHKVTLNVGNPSGNDVMVRIALRNAPTAYANYYENGTALDLSSSPGTVDFPLVGNFAAGRMIFNIDVPAGSGSGQHNNTEATLYDVIVAKLQANTTLSKLFTVTDNTTTLDIEARHAGVVFDVTVAYTSGTVAGTTVGSSSLITTTGFDAGAGNYWQVLSDEKSQRARYGNFNRMYFPMAFHEFAQSGNTYEVVQIQYAHNHPADTGIARAAELNSITIYSKVTAEDSTKADLVFLGSDTSTWGSAAVERIL